MRRKMWPILVAAYAAFCTVTASAVSSTAASGLSCEEHYHPNPSQHQPEPGTRPPPPRPACEQGVDYEGYDNVHPMEYDKNGRAAAAIARGAATTAAAASAAAASVNRRRHAREPARDGPRVNLDLRVESNRASRQRSAEQAADTFLGVRQLPARHSSPTAEQVAEAIRRDEQNSRQRQSPGSQPLGFNLGQYRDEQQHSPLAHAAEAFITTPPSSRQRAFSTPGLMGPLRPLVWKGPNLTLSPLLGSSMHQRQQEQDAEQQQSLGT